MEQRWNPSPPPVPGRMIVVGGQCSKIGKTALIVDLLSSFRKSRSLEWTAVTPHIESGCPVNGPRCTCEADEHLFAVTEQGTVYSQGDTSRFLDAGSKQALWVQSKAGHLREALPTLSRLLASSKHIIIESNAILEFWRPMAFFMVLDPSNPDFKQSARQAIPFADVFVLRSPFRPAGPFESPPQDLSSRPTFMQLLGEPLPVGVQELARQVLLSSRASP